MKKLILNLVAILALVSSVYATDDSKTIPTATTTNILSGQFHLQSLEVINNAAAAQTVKFYDAPTTAILWTNVAWTNWSTVVSNLVVTTTNYNGVVETATNLVTVTTANPHAVAANTYRLFKTMVIGAGATTTWTPISGVYLSYGMTMTNSDTNVTVNWSYSSVR